MDAMKQRLVRRYAFLPPFRDPVHDYKDTNFTRCEYLLWTFRGHAIRTWIGVIGQPTPGRPILMYNYGQCEHGKMKQSVEFIVQIAKEVQLCVVMYDYPGYPLDAEAGVQQLDTVSKVLSTTPATTGVPVDPSEEALFATADMVFGYVRRTYPQNPILLFGRSMGTTVCCHLIRHYNADIVGMVLLSPPASGLRAFTYQLFHSITFGLVPDEWIQRINFGWLDCFDSLTMIRSGSACGTAWKPVMICHGEDDTYCPIQGAKALHEAFGPMSTFVSIPKRGHIDITPTDLTEMTQWVRRLKQKTISQTMSSVN